MHINVGKWITAALAVVIVGGCSSAPDKAVTDIESRLSAAGFAIKLTDTREKLKHLDSMAQYRLFPINRDGGMVFVYADGAGC